MDADRLPRPIADALRAVRITEAMQYCFMPSGDWQTDASPAPYKPADAVGFHIMVGGRCWLEIGGARHMLEQGDIAAFPRGTGHRLGVGTDGALFDPGAALPPPPWQATPMLRFGDGGRQVRLLCGYVTCEAMNFPLFRQMMPDFIHLRTGGGEDWLAGTLRQIVQEVDRPEAGGVAVLERLTEVALLEVLRRQFARQRAEAPGTGWLAAAHDPVVGRALAMLHERPAEGWTLVRLARAAGQSRSVLSGRFAATLGVAPIAYLRQWRLFLASRALAGSGDGMARIAQAAGYGTEAAFSRAFARQYGMPPAQWRRRARAETGQSVG